MASHLLVVLAITELRSEGPTRSLRLSCTGQALVLSGKNFVQMDAFELFESWHDLEAYLQEHALRLPPLVEISSQPPFSLRVEPIAPDENEGAREEYKVLWTRDGKDRHVIHTPDSESARVFSQYVYFNGVQSGPLGFSLPISAVTP